MKISLFIPCYVDQFLPRIGICMVEVLERLGHQVAYPEEQTCCGQPAFNSGFCDDARSVGRAFLECFQDADIVAVPSGSCATMIRVFYQQLFEGRTEVEAAKRLAERTFEFSELLVRKLCIQDVGARFPHRVTFHDGCHGLRELGLKNEPRQLLQHVDGLELIEADEAETCCGFGGSFSVEFPQISTSMAEVKCESIERTGAEYVVSNDPTCLMQIQGLLDRRESAVKCLHLVEVLNHR